MNLQIKSDGTKSYLLDEYGTILIDNLKYASFINDDFINILNESGNNIFDIKTKKIYFENFYKSIIFDENGFFLLKDDFGYKIFQIETKKIIERIFKQKPIILKENNLIFVKEKIDYNKYNYYIVIEKEEKTILIPKDLYDYKDKFSVISIQKEDLLYYKNKYLYFKNAFLVGEYFYLQKSSEYLVLDEKLEHLFENFVEITNIFSNYIFIKENFKINIFSLADRKYLYKGFEKIQFLNENNAIFLTGKENSILFTIDNNVLKFVKSFLSFSEFSQNLLIVDIDSKYKNIFDMEKLDIILSENFLIIEYIDGLNFIVLHYENKINLHYKDNLKLFKTFKTTQKLKAFLDEIKDLKKFIQSLKNDGSDIIKSIKKYGINNIKTKSGVLLLSKSENIFLDENNNILEKWYLNKDIVINLSKKNYEISYIIENIITKNLKQNSTFDYIYELSVMLVNMVISNSTNGINDFQGPVCYENFDMFISFGQKAEISEIKTIIDLFKENKNISLGNYPIENLFLGIIENEKFLLEKDYFKSIIDIFLEGEEYLDRVILSLCKNQYFEKSYLQNIVNKYFLDVDKKQELIDLLK